MLSTRLLNTGLLAGLSMLSLSAAQLSFPAISPDYDVWGEMDNALLEVAQPPGLSVSQWAPGWVPQSCYDDGWLWPLEAADFTVYNVTYDDCSEPFVVCRHKDTEASLGLIFISIARLPARVRQWVGNFVAIPTLRPQNSGWQSGATIVIQDNYWFYPGLMVHEATHVIDLIKLGGTYPNSWNYYSNSDDWTSKVSADGVLASGYAATNYIESFAEIGRISAYDFAVAGGLAALPPPVSQIQNQLQEYARLLAADFAPGQTCNGKVPSSNPIAIGGSLRKGQKLGPEPSVKVTTVPEIRVPEEVKNLKPNCTLHGVDH